MRLITCTTLLCVLLALIDTRQSYCEAGRIPVRYQTGQIFGKRQMTDEDVLRALDGPYGRNLLDLMKLSVYRLNQLEGAQEVESK
uniref:SIfamide n=1 Tax=Ophionotus victoriae TaxID=667017 RepID=A0A220W0J5_9ECHI|nr:SIfamide precursor [Ophionotus victoriae]